MKKLIERINQWMTEEKADGMTPEKVKWTYAGGAIDLTGMPVDQYYVSIALYAIKTEVEIEMHKEKWHCVINVCPGVTLHNLPVRKNGDRGLQLSGEEDGRDPLIFKKGPFPQADTWLATVSVVERNLDYYLLEGGREWFSDQ